MGLYKFDDITPMIYLVLASKSEQRSTVDISYLPTYL